MLNKVIYICLILYLNSDISLSTEPKPIISPEYSVISSNGPTEVPKKVETNLIAETGSNPSKSVESKETESIENVLKERIDTETRENIVSKENIIDRRQFLDILRDSDEFIDDDSFEDTDLKNLQYLQELNSSANQPSKKKDSSSSQCSEIYEGEEFYIRSPNYPGNYPSFTSCRYTIRRHSRDVCGIELTLLRFDLQPPSDAPTPFVDFNSRKPFFRNDRGICQGDRLIVDDQILCGRYRRGTQAFIKFAGSSISMKFDSRSGYGASGFLLKGRQMKHCQPSTEFGQSLKSSMHCDREIMEEEFTLLSPGHPLNYPNELECLYMVRQKNQEVCGLLLTPLHFNVEGASFCMFDYVEIQGRRLCGNVTKSDPMYFMFDEGKVEIRFRTDESSSRDGFELEGRQMLCKDLKYFQPIHSPLKIPIKLDDSDEVLNEITRPALSRTALADIGSDERNPKNFDSGMSSPSTSIEASDGRIRFFFDYNGNKVPTPKDQSKEDSRRPNTLRFIPSIAHLKLESLENGLSGLPPFPGTFDNGPLTTSEEVDHCFNATYAQRSFVIKSPGFPNFYPSDLDCNYYIRPYARDVCGLRITIETLDVDNGNGGSCPSDYLVIAGQRFCGQITKQVVNVAFSGSQTVFRFHTDSSGSAAGFLALVEQIRGDCNNRIPSHSIPNVQKDSCNTYIERQEATLVSPGYPSGYPPNIHCTTTIAKVGPHIKSLLISFDEFDVEHSVNCMKDALLVGHRRFCGLRKGNTHTIPFLGERTNIVFNSDESVTGKGYKIFVRQLSQENGVDQQHIPQHHTCGGTFNTRAFTLTSPNYPSAYPVNAHCVYSIIRASQDICQLEFQVLDLSIEASAGCRKDYLQFGKQGRTCGKKSAPETRTYHFTSDQFAMIFRSDFAGVSTGFKIQVFQKSCHGIPDSHEGSVEIHESGEWHHQHNHHIPTHPVVPHGHVFSSGGRRPYSHRPAYRPPHGMKPFAHLHNKMKGAYNFLFKPMFKHRRPHAPNVPHINHQYTHHNHHGHHYQGYQQVKVVPQCNPCNSVQSQCNPCKSVPEVKPDISDENWSIGHQSFEHVEVPKPAPVFQVSHHFDKSPTYLYHEHHRPQTNYYHQSQQTHTGASHAVKAKPVVAPISKESSEIYGSKPAFSCCQGKSPNLASSDERPTSPKTYRGQLISHFRRPVSYYTSSSQNPPLFSHPKGSNEVLMNLKSENDNRLPQNMCNSSIHEESFKMRSPGHLRSDTNCRYSVHKNRDSCCGLFIDIDMLDLPTGRSHRCQNSYLSIGGRKICGTLSSPLRTMIPFPSKSPISIVYRADPSNLGRGFSLTGTQVPCNLSSSDEDFKSDEIPQASFRQNYRGRSHYHHPQAFTFTSTHLDARDSRSNENRIRSNFRAYPRGRHPRPVWGVRHGRARPNLPYNGHSSYISYDRSQG